MTRRVVVSVDYIDNRRRISGWWGIPICAAAAIPFYFSARWAWPTLTHHWPTGRTAGLALAASILIGVLIPRLLLTIAAWWEFTRSTDYRRTSSGFIVSPLVSGYLGTIVALAVAPWTRAGAERLMAGPFGAWPEKLAWLALGGTVALLLPLIVLATPQAWPPGEAVASPGWTKIFYPITIPLALLFPRLTSLRKLLPPFLVVFVPVYAWEMVLFDRHSWSDRRDPRHVYNHEFYQLHHSFRPDGKLHALYYPRLFGNLTDRLEAWVSPSLHPYESWHHSLPLLVYMGYYAGMYGLGAVIIFVVLHLLTSSSKEAI